MNGYELSRKWFDFCFLNPEKIKPNHTALYFFAIEHCNRLGWKEKYGLPSTMTMEAIGIKSHNTYMKAFNDLEEFGFIKVIERSKNQYSANIIALSNFNKALDKALDKALIKHDTKQSESTIQSIDSIDKQTTINNKHNTSATPKIDFDILLDLINKQTNRSFKVINKTTKNKYKARLKEGYTKEDIKNTILNAVKDKFHKDENFKYLTPEYFSRAKTIDSYSQEATTTKKPFDTTNPYPQHNHDDSEAREDYEKWRKTQS